MLLKTNLSLSERIVHFANTTPLATAVCHIKEDGSFETISYKELLEKTLSIAEALKKYASEGDRIIICLPTGLDYIVTFLGCMFAGIIAVPCMPPLNRESAMRLNLIIKDSKACLAISNKEILGAFEKLNWINLLDNQLTKPIYKMLSTVHRDIKITTNKERWIAVEDIPLSATDDVQFSFRYEEPVFLQYTSGSTANPRGVKVSMKNLMANFDTISYNTGYQGEPLNCLTWLPLYHDMGLIGNTLFALSKGGAITVMAPYDFLQDPTKWLKNVSKFKANWTGAPNFAFELVMKKMSEEDTNKLDLSSLKWLFNGAEPINYNTLQAFLNKFKLDEKVIFPVYGLAETTLMVSGYKENEKITTLKIKKGPYREGKIELFNEGDEGDYVELTSCGKPDPKIHLEIIDIHTNEMISEGQVGEICLDSDSVSSGYWENNKETMQHFSFMRNGVRIHMLCTEDLGFLYQGELFFTGRKKDTIHIEGRIYYPQDIEKIVKEAHANIREGCITAFTVGEDLIIVAEIKDKVAGEEIDNIRTQVFQHFGINPKDIKLILSRSILKTTSGKLRRRDMRQRYLDNKLNLVE